MPPYLSVEPAAGTSITEMGFMMKGGISSDSMHYKDGWSADMAISGLLKDVIKRCKEFKATTRSWSNDNKRDYDENWARVYVLSDLQHSDCFQSRGRVLAYLQDLMTRRVPPPLGPSIQGGSRRRELCLSRN